jgi:hypothetical protein
MQMGGCNQQPAKPSAVRQHLARIVMDPIGYDALEAIRAPLRMRD